VLGQGIDRFSAHTGSRTTERLPLTPVVLKNSKTEVRQKTSDIATLVNIAAQCFLNQIRCDARRLIAEMAEPTSIFDAHIHGLPKRRPSSTVSPQLGRLWRLGLLPSSGYAET
jgi:hypothetical protein